MDLAVNPWWWQDQCLVHDIGYIATRYIFGGSKMSHYLLLYVPLSSCWEQRCFSKSWILSFQKRFRLWRCVLTSFPCGPVQEGAAYREVKFVTRGPRRTWSGRQAHRWWRRDVSVVEFSVSTVLPVHWKQSGRKTCFSKCRNFHPSRFVSLKRALVSFISEAYTTDLSWHRLL